MSRQKRDRQKNDNIDERDYDRCRSDFAAAIDGRLRRSLAQTEVTRDVLQNDGRIVNEYPDRKGAFPVIAVTWREAGALCEDRGARLCSEDEWTFACEGEEALPYPTGFVRDESACVIDRPWRLFDERLLAVRDSALAIGEIDYVWQGEASGSRPLCRSPFGVYDTTGNVDEWTRSTQREGYESVFKGGYWGPVRARCRAATRAHNEDFYFYQQGFRCCTDAPKVEPSPADAGGLIVKGP